MAKDRKHNGSKSDIVLPEGPVSQRRGSVAERRRLLKGTAAGNTTVTLTQLRVAAYCRVSTGESVASNLSIPDQERYMRKFAEDRNWQLIKVYKEEGRSAKTINRPVFKEMIEELLNGKLKIKKLLVYHTARFSRRMRDFDEYESLLYENGIEVIFTTQQFSRDIGGFIGKAGSTLFDEVHSRKTAEDTSRTMTELALGGFYVGGVLPLGYKAVPLESNPLRKIIVINEEERPLVRRIFDMALYGTSGSGPMGMKAIAMKLNEEGCWPRRVKRWNKTHIHRLVTNPIYKGTKLYNECAQDEQWLSRPAELITIPVPPIVTPEEFDALAEQLQRKDPRKGGTSKAFSSPLLLSGIAFCACGAHMTLSTGRNRFGQTYRYYHCGSEDRTGKIDCDGPRVPESTLDQMVIDSVVTHVLEPRRIRTLLEKLREQFISEELQREGHAQALRDRLKEAELAFENVYTIAKYSPNLANEPLILGERNEWPTAFVI
ncbi:hypothetical protein AS026_28600 [Rhizobium altiplani]|uniref:Recombinase domain-containing protein n=1 Tax=Rhizobium altiplani TaxID=1864509 RepID=A0A109K281_9HYPH|nr:recombinase family protein [Rhizobium altiplani]KWV59348.1 hypothetical protein AS026_28600 [Rhizobium altiplani]